MARRRMVDIGDMNLRAPTSTTRRKTMTTRIYARQG